MLVLSRKIDESIVIGTDESIIITVLSIDYDKVRIGIEAPMEIPVHREEVAERIKREGPREHYGD